MMIIEFDKYQGAGNDFVILNNKTGVYDSLSTAQVAFLCDRYKGIGADGLILINASSTSDFEMQYFNSDGNESTLCGNGGRCAVAFAYNKKIIDKTTSFSAIDGLHKASYISPLEVHLEMQEVTKIIEVENGLLIDTGSPHYIRLVDNIEAINVQKEGAAIRYSDSFMPNGINVNFVEKEGITKYKIRTYERGVENETLACGTGAVAAAIAIHSEGESEGETEVDLKALGGDLKVSFEVSDKRYYQIYLKGPAMHVFSGTIQL